MVRLTRIYTRGGDKGETSLGDGARVKKHDARVAAFGEVDEANAAIGLVRLEIDRKLDPLLAKIQNDLFDLGADLCRPADPKDGRPALRITAAQVEALEQAIDQFNAGLKPLESFVLPAGSRAAAALHLARVVTRRAERAMTALAESGPVNPEAIKYVNRLSDLLFVLARLANDGGTGDVLWRPGGEAAKS